MPSFSYPPGGPPADLLVEGRGVTLGEAIAGVALGMYNSITPVAGVSPAEEFTAEAEGSDLQGLLLNILDELLYINDTEGFVAHDCAVEVDEGKLKARASCRGERFEPGRHEPGISVKAVTYHLMSIKREGDSWVVRVVFDT